MSPWPRPRFAAPTVRVSISRSSLNAGECSSRPWGQSPRKRKWRSQWFPVSGFVREGYASEKTSGPRSSRCSRPSCSWTTRSAADRGLSNSTRWQAGSTQCSWRASRDAGSRFPTSAHGAEGEGRPRTTRFGFFGSPTRTKTDRHRPARGTAHIRRPATSASVGRKRAKRRGEAAVTRRANAPLSYGLSCRHGPAEENLPTGAAGNDESARSEIPQDRPTSAKYHSYSINYSLNWNSIYGTACFFGTMKTNNPARDGAGTREGVSLSPASPSSLPKEERAEPTYPLRVARV